MATRTERIEARFPPELKALAERAAVASGQTLTDYLASLVRLDAPKRLQSANEVILTNEQFDQFLAACETAQPPSKKLLDAAKKLDAEGY